MKKFLLTKFLSLVMLCSFAEGYQVNLQSVRQTGMGHTGVALRLGAESMHFNPAGLVFMRNSVQFSGGFSAIFSNNEYKSGSLSWETDNGIGTPAYFYAGFKVYDNLAFGLSFTTPYGNSLDWGKNWYGAHMVQDIKLKSYYFQPTVSYKVNEKLSVGAGMMIVAGDFDLNKGLFERGGGALKPLLNANFGTRYDDVVPASLNLNGKADIALGYNIGLMYEIDDRFTVGISYRSKIEVKVDGGKAKTSYASDELKAALSSQLPPLEQGDFVAELPMPANTTIGLSYKANDRLKLAAEVQMVQWNAYKELAFDFSPAALDVADVTSKKNYENAMVYRVGAEYKMTERLELRAGAYYDETPIQSELYNPETPGMNKLGLSFGASFSPVKNFTVDFALLYIHGFDIDGSTPDPNPVVPNRIFSGNYSSNAIIPSLGLTYSF
jgi:long-chain fatty acid transport protein